MEAHEQREDDAAEDGREGEEEILSRDDAVIGAEEPEKSAIWMLALH
jgi:hypothetical protein